MRAEVAEADMMQPAAVVGNRYAVSPKLLEQLNQTDKNLQRVLKEAHKAAQPDRERHQHASALAERILNVFGLFDSRKDRDSNTGKPMALRIVDMKPSELRDLFQQQPGVAEIVARALHSVSKWIGAVRSPQYLHRKILVLERATLLDPSSYQMAGELAVASSKLSERKHLVPHSGPTELVRIREKALRATGEALKHLSGIKLGDVAARYSKGVIAKVNWKHAAETEPYEQRKIDSEVISLIGKSAVLALQAAALSLEALKSGNGSASQVVKADPIQLKAEQEKARKWEQTGLAFCEQFLLVQDYPAGWRAAGPELQKAVKDCPELLEPANNPWGIEPLSADFPDLFRALGQLYRAKGDSENSALCEKISQDLSRKGKQHGEKQPQVTAQPKASRSQHAA